MYKLPLPLKECGDPLITFQNLSFNNKKDQSVKTDKN